MSQKRMGEWTDFIGKSTLPDDASTFTNGTNFGLDSFQFDVPDGAGIEDAARLPEVKGLSGLPDGLVMTAEAPLDEAEVMGEDDGAPTLISMLSEDEGGLAKDAAVIDLNWLDPTQGQDPNRLPDNDIRHDALAQLEVAWGEPEQKSAHLIPFRDKEAAEYEASLQEIPVATKTAEEFEDALRRAVRLSHYGHSIKSIKKELVATLGQDARRARQAMQLIETEHGLAGTVFVRASAFPGLRNGKWAKELRQIARTARYVITDDQAVATKLSMEMVPDVESIPWKRAYLHYAPTLKATGHKLASRDPRESLRQAFLSGPAIVEQEPAPKPDMTPVVATEEEAQQALAAVDRTPVAVQSSEDQARARKMQTVLVRIAKWVQNGTLSQQDALRLHAHTKSASMLPESILKAAAALVAASGETPVYDGAGKYLSQDAQQARLQVWASLDKEQSELDTALFKRAQADLLQAVKGGVLTVLEAQNLAKMSTNATELRRLTATAIEAVHSKRTVELPEVKTATYQGTSFVEAVAPSHQKPVEDRKARLKQALDLKFNLWLKSIYAANLLTKEEVAKITAMGKPMAETKKLVEAAIHMASTLRQENLAPTKTATYQGATFTENVASTERQVVGVQDERLQEVILKRESAKLDRMVAGGLITKADANAKRQAFTQQQQLIKLAASTGIEVSEFHSLLRWAHQRMTEGLAGQELDQVMRARFSAPLIKAATPMLKEARAKHEGLSGFIYVDAAAYASAAGSTGCEKHAAKHRVNAMKYVLAMPRCASCTFKNADGYCTQYNKKLSSKVPVDDPAAYQKKTLHMADATDHEVTAAMFDQHEYGLQNSALDGISLNESAGMESLGDVLFGGMDISQQ
jgi:hypothetical protein